MKGAGDSGGSEAKAGIRPSCWDIYFHQGWPGCFRVWGGSVGCRGPLRLLFMRYLGGGREVGLAYLSLTPSWLST